MLKYESLITLFRLLQVGRNFFSKPEGRVITLGNGMDLWYGVFQSAILGSGNMYLNVDGKIKFNLTIAYKKTITSQI